MTDDRPARVLVIASTAAEASRIAAAAPGSDLAVTVVGEIVADGDPGGETARRVRDAMATDADAAIMDVDHGAFALDALDRLFGDRDAGPRTYTLRPDDGHAARLDAIARAERTIRLAAASARPSPHRPMPGDQPWRGRRPR